MAEEEVTIAEDDLSDGKVVSFMEAHLQHLRRITPPGCVNALGLDALRNPKITFFSARCGDALVGTIALKELSKTAGEMKAMRVSECQRRKGIGKRLVDKLMQIAQSREYEVVYLETGAGPEFQPAVRLYEKYGFGRTTAFGEYTDNPNSVFMKCELQRTCP